LVKFSFQGRRGGSGGLAVVAAGLGAFEHVEGAEPGAADGVFVADQEGEAVVAADVLQQGGAEQAGDFVVLVGAVGGLFGFAVADLAHAFPEQAGLGAGEAVQAPLGDGEVADEGLLQVADGLAVFIEGFQHGDEVFVFFVVEDDVLGEQAMFQGIEARTGLAFGCFGAGAFEGVPAVCFDLSQR